MTLGNYLRLRREQAGYTQKVVATTMGYGSAQFISNVERDKCDPPEPMLKKMVKLYDLNRTVLLEFLVARETQRLKAILKLK